MAYATKDDIQEYLGITIDSSTTPKDTTVNRWLEVESLELENTIKDNFDTRVVTDAILDVTSDTTNTSATNFDMTRFTHIPARRDMITLPDKNVVSLTKVELNVKAWGETPEWEELSIGLGGDVRLFQNHIQFLRPRVRPIKGNFKLRVTYQHGNSELLAFAEDVVILKTALRVIDQRLISESGDGTGGPVRIGDISIDSNRSFDLDLRERTEAALEKRIGKMGTFNAYVI